MDITPAEIEVLHKWHTGNADYLLACKQTNSDMAKRANPKYNGKHKTEWLKRVELYDATRKYHRDRARELLKVLSEHNARITGNKRNYRPVIYENRNLNAHRNQD